MIGERIDGVASKPFDLVMPANAGIQNPLLAAQ